MRVRAKLIEIVNWTQRRTISINEVLLLARSDDEPGDAESRVNFSLLSQLVEKREKDRTDSHVGEK